MLNIGRKKVFLLVASLVLISLFSNAASAQEDDGGLAGAFDTIRELFGFIPDVVTLDKLIGGDAAALFWAKFLIWLLLFAVIYFGASFVFKDNKRIAVVVAIAISLMSTLLIPNAIVINIFQTYGLLAGILVWVIPVAAGFWLNSKIQQPGLKVLTYLGMLFILLSIDKTISSNLGSAWAPTSRWFDFFRLLLVFVIIALIWNLFSMGFGARGQEAVGGWFGDRGRDAWDWATRRGPEEGWFDRFRRRREPRTPEEEQRLVDEAQEVKKKIEALEEQLRKKLKTADERQLLIELAELINQLDAVQKELIRLERI